MSNARWTWHGGGLRAAQARFGAGNLPWLDLSTGVNPHAWPDADSLAIDWRRLPETADISALERAAAAHFGTDPGHLCAVPGTEIGLRLAGSLLPGPAWHVAPAYRTHAEMMPDARAIAAGDLPAAPPGTLILANPNNPDGRLLDPTALAALADTRGTDGWLLVDEAFVDPHPDHSLALWIDDDRRLLLFRSFGKFFGLAGLRLGFVLGPRPLIVRLRAMLGAWPVSAAAVSIGTAAYRDAEWIAMMRDRLRTDARALDTMLTRLGHPPAGACPLFRLIAVPDAIALFERLARQAILTRPFEHDPHWLRLGLPGDDEDLMRLEAALAHG